MIALDLVLEFFFSNAEETTEDGKISPLALIAPAFLIAIACALATVFMRAICRLGNMWLDEENLKRRPRFAYGMLALSWALMFIINAGSLWWSVGSGRCLGAEESEQIIILWCSAVFVGWIVIEPAQVIFLVLAPILLSRGYGCGETMGKVNEWLERCGIDGAFLASLFL